MLKILVGMMRLFKYGGKAVRECTLHAIREESDLIVRSNICLHEDPGEAVLWIRDKLERIRIRESLQLTSFFKDKVIKKSKNSKNKVLTIFR
jgi:hypothetical protein